MTDTVIARFAGDGSVGVATPAEPSSPRAEPTRPTLARGERNDMVIDKVFTYFNNISWTLCYVLQVDAFFVSPADMAVPATGAGR